MSDKFQSKLLADVFVDRICWAMRTDDRIIARGVCLTFEDLAGVATRAGIFDVLIEDGFRSEEVRAAALRWRHPDRAILRRGYPRVATQQDQLS